MPRHLDLAALRALVTTAEVGGVTRAAGHLNLTQSAVSMQLKRLEDSLGQPLIDRSGRGVALTAQGEQVAAYARRLLTLNDEVWAKMTDHEFEGEVAFGAPHDVIYPHVPAILQRFARDYPRVRVRLVSLFTQDLKALLARGELDLILTTEEAGDPGSETLTRLPLVWVGAAGGSAWRARPLRFGTTLRCLFRKPAFAALEAADVPWEVAVDAESSLPVEASVAADLAVSVTLDIAVPQGCEVIRHGGALPPLPCYAISMYVGNGAKRRLAGRLAEFVRSGFAGTGERLAAE